MTGRIYIFIICFIMFLAFESCQESYYNNDLDVSEKIPCVDARITNYNDNHFVKLYYARPYNQDGYTDISGANVRVTDDLGNVYTFNELYAGYYQIERGYLVAQKGIIYTLIVDLPDGTIIKSFPQEMVDTIGIQNLNYPIGLQEVVVKGSDDQFRTVYIEGYSYEITPLQPSDKKVYFRLKSDFYVYSTSIDVHEKEVEYKNETGDTMITAKITASENFDCYEFFTDTELPIIGELNPEINLSDEERTIQTQFLMKDYSFYTSNNFVEWVVMADVYSINQVTYQYYQALSEQLTAPDRIFDPIPSQLTGNMYCSSDTNQKVLGLFDVTAKSRRYHALYKYISYGAESIQSRFYPDSTKYYNDCKSVNTLYDTLIIGISPIVN